MQGCILQHHANALAQPIFSMLLHRKKSGLQKAVRKFSVVLLQAEALVEAINTSTGVNQLLLAGIERVALGADFHTNVLLGGTSGKDIAAGAADGGLFVLGMDTFLHFVHLFRIM